MAQERSIEVKVGALILASGSVLVGLILILGGLSFRPKYTVYVDFNNPGGLQVGVPVRMAGVKVGTVEDINFRPEKPKAGEVRPALVRATVRIEKRLQDTIRENSDFYVTTQGVLGEQFMALEPGTPDHPSLAENAVVRGIDPPRIDLFVAKGYELLDTTVTALNNNRELISDAAHNAANLLKSLNTVLGENQDSLKRTVLGVEALVQEARDLTSHAQKNYIDNPQLIRVVSNLDKMSSELAQHSAPMIKDAKESLANLNRASQLVGSPEEQAKLKKAIADVSELADRANKAVADAQGIVSHIKKGQGTVGALVMDEAVFDDVQEMVRDLKHNPWKFLWRE